MDYLIAAATKRVIKKPVTGDDIVDRLHYFATVTIMVIFAIISGLQEYVGDPINCWTPTEFNSDSNNYYTHINGYCWIQKLRYPKYQTGYITANNSQGSPDDADQFNGQSDFSTAIFKWITPLFIVQACFFKLPNFLWHRLNTTSGTDLQKIRDLVTEAQDAKKNDESKLKMDEMVTYFEDWVTGYRAYHLKLVGKHSATFLSVLFCLGKKSGSYLSSLYIFIKLLNILNVLFMFVFLTVVLDFSFWKYGFTVLISVLRSGDWHDSQNFPRLLLCDFVLEGGIASDTDAPTHVKYEVQCLMTLNLLLEKMFAIEWFWLAFLLTMSLINMISWAVKIKPPCSTILFSKKYMKVLKYYYTTDTTGGNKSSLSYSLEEFGSSLKGFTEDYLKSDGVFVLRLLELNASRVVVSDVVGHLWSHYLIMNSCKLLSYTKDISNNNNNDSEKTQIDMDESVVIVTDSIL